MAKKPPWEELEHTADLALRARGKTRPALFRNAAFGLAALLGGETDSTDTFVEISIQYKASTLGLLLHELLREILLAVEEHGLVLTEVVIKQLKDNDLSADIIGNPGGRFSRYIKAVTFHNLEVKRGPEGYEATIVFDV